jgi:hypothetical protein
MIQDICDALYYWLFHLITVFGLVQQLLLTKMTQTYKFQHIEIYTQTRSEFSHWCLISPADRKPCHATFLKLNPTGGPIIAFNDQIADLPKVCSNSFVHRRSFSRLGQQEATQMEQKEFCTTEQNFMLLTS